MTREVVSGVEEVGEHCTGVCMVGVVRGYWKYVGVVGIMITAIVVLTIL